MLAADLDETTRMAQRKGARPHPAGGRGAIRGSLRAFSQQGIPMKLVGSFLVANKVGGEHSPRRRPHQNERECPGVFSLICYMPLRTLRAIPPSSASPPPW